jgi:YVTN family beta-propeller protein
MELKGFIGLPRIRTPHGVVFLPDDERVAVVAEDSKRILIVNIETGKIEQSMRTQQEMPHLAVLNHRMNQIFVSNIRSNTVNVYDLNTISGLKMVPTGANPEGMDISPDGKEVWIAERLGNSISVLDTSTLEIVDSIPCPGAPLRVAFTPDGRHALVSASLSSEVAVFNARTRREVIRIPMDYSAAEKSTPEIQSKLKPVPASLCVEPDSSLCYVVSGNSDLITVIDLVKWAIKTRLKTGQIPDGIALFDE